MITETLFISSESSISHPVLVVCLQSILKFLPREFWTPTINKLLCIDKRCIARFIENHRVNNAFGMLLNECEKSEIHLTESDDGREIRITFRYRHASIEKEIDDLILHLITDIKAHDENYRVGIEYYNSENDLRIS